MARDAREYEIIVTIIIIIIIAEGVARDARVSRGIPSAVIVIIKMVIMIISYPAAPRGAAGYARPRARARGLAPFGPARRSESHHNDRCLQTGLSL